MEKKTYLVTGGAGFVGSHMAAYLIKNGHDVHIVDNMITGQQANLDYLSTLGNYHFHQMSITETESLIAVLRSGIDTIFHFAALASVPLSVEDPLSTNHHCVDGTLSVLYAAKEAGVRKVIYSASSAAYGEADDPNITEQALPAPISPYGVAKVVGEYYCQAFYRTYGLSTVSLRYFNIFGSRQDPNSQYAAVIPKFITMMLDGQSPKIFGDGLQTRDFTHVDNVVHANWIAANNAAADGKTFNIATGQSISVLDMVEALNKTLGTDIAPTFLPERTGDIKHSGASIQQAQDVIGFQPIVDFEEGLSKTVAWYRENQDTHEN